jgi:hypothetical protein
MLYVSGIYCDKNKYTDVLCGFSAEVCNVTIRDIGDNHRGFYTSFVLLQTKLNPPLCSVQNTAHGGCKSFTKRIMKNIPPTTKNIQNKEGLHNRDIYMGLCLPTLSLLQKSITDIELITDEFRAGCLLFITL